MLGSLGVSAFDFFVLFASSVRASSLRFFTPSSFLGAGWGSFGSACCVLSFFLAGAALVAWGSSAVLGSLGVSAFDFFVLFASWVWASFLPFFTPASFLGAGWGSFGSACALSFFLAGAALEASGCFGPLGSLGVSALSCFFAFPFGSATSTSFVSSSFFLGFSFFDMSCFFFFLSARSAFFLRLPQPGSNFSTQPPPHPIPLILFSLTLHGLVILCFHRRCLHLSHFLRAHLVRGTDANMVRWWGIPGDVW